MSLTTVFIIIGIVAYILAGVATFMGMMLLMNPHIMLMAFFGPNKEEIPLFGTGRSLLAALFWPIGIPIMGVMFVMGRLRAKKPIDLNKFRKND